MNYRQTLPKMTGRKTIFRAFRCEPSLSLSLILYVRRHLIFRQEFSSLSYSFCSVVSGWCSNKSVRIWNFSPLCMLSSVTLKLFCFNATSFEGESSSKRQIHSSNVKTLFAQVISLLASPIIFLQCLPHTLQSKI